MGAEYFISDLHLFHPHVAEIRGFTDVEAHNDWICERWTRYIKPDDRVWLLGDVAVQRYHEALALLKELPGTKILIAGNHDPSHPMNRRAARGVREALEVFESVQPFAVRKMAGHDVLFSHFPYSGDHTNVDRYRQFRLPDLGRWLLHGHTHSTVAYDSAAQPRQIHVGIDAWLRPVSRSEIEEIISEQAPTSHPYIPPSGFGRGDPLA